LNPTLKALGGKKKKVSSDTLEQDFFKDCDYNTEKYTAHGEALSNQIV